MTTQETGQRYHAMDALRASAMLLGLVLHVAVPYMRIETEYWPVEDRATSVFFDISVLTIHSFRIPMFFLLSGFFAHMLYIRLGPAEFARRRAVRLLVPFIVGMVLIIPLVHIVWVYGQITQDPASHAAPLWPAVVDFYRANLRHALTSTSHLWFLYYLILMTAIMLAAAPVAARLPALRSLAGLDGFCRWLLTSPFRPIFLAALTLPVLEIMPQWHVDSPLSIIPAWRPLLYYGSFFSLGIILFRHRDLLSRMGGVGSWWPAYLAVGLGGVLPLLLALIDRADVERSTGISWQTDLAGRATYVLLAWFLIFGLIGLALRLCQRPLPWVRYLADASYWIYLAHLPLVIYITAILRDAPGNAFAKFTVAMAASLGILLGTYQLFVRYTIIGRTLNGRRTRAPTVA